MSAFAFDRPSSDGVPEPSPLQQLGAPHAYASTSSAIRTRRLTPPKRTSIVLPSPPAATAAADGAAAAAIDQPAQATPAERSHDGVPPLDTAATGDDVKARDKQTGVPFEPVLPSVIVAPQPTVPIPLRRAGSASDAPAAVADESSAVTLESIVPATSESASSSPPLEGDADRSCFSPDLSRYFGQSLGLRLPAQDGALSPSPPLPSLAEAGIVSVPGSLSISGLPSPSSLSALSSGTASSSSFSSAAPSATSASSLSLRSYSSTSFAQSHSAGALPGSSGESSACPSAASSDGRPRANLSLGVGSATHAGASSSVSSSVASSLSAGVGGKSKRGLGSMRHGYKRFSSQQHPPVHQQQPHLLRRDDLTTDDTDTPTFAKEATDPDAVADAEADDDADADADALQRFSACLSEVPSASSSMSMTDSFSSAGALSVGSASSSRSCGGSLSSGFASASSLLSGSSASLSAPASAALPSSSPPSAAVSTPLLAGVSESSINDVAGDEDPVVTGSLVSGMDESLAASTSSSSRMLAAGEVVFDEALLHGAITEQDLTNRRRGAGDDGGDSADNSVSPAAVAAAAALSRLSPSPEPEPLSSPSSAQGNLSPSASHATVPAAKLVHVHHHVPSTFTFETRKLRDVAVPATSPLAAAASPAGDALPTAASPAFGTELGASPTPPSDSEPVSFVDAPVDPDPGASSLPRGSPGSGTRRAGAPPFGLAEIKLSAMDPAVDSGLGKCLPTPLHQSDFADVGGVGVAASGSSSSSSSQHSSAAPSRRLSLHQRQALAHAQHMRASSMDNYTAMSSAQQQHQQHQQLQQEDLSVQPPWPPVGTPLGGGARPGRRLSRSGSQIAADEAAAAMMSPSMMATAVGSSPFPSLPLSRAERRALYVSSAPHAVRFVSSYASATAGCMRATQLSSRDPALVGKLLRYFVGGFVERQWRALLALVAAIIAIHSAGASRAVFSWTPLGLLLFVLYKLLFAASVLSVELAPNVPLRFFQFYKHPRLLARAKSLPVARLYGSSQAQTAAGGSSGMVSCSTPGTPNTPNTPNPLANGSLTPVTPGSASTAIAAAPSSSPASSAALMSALANDILYQPSEGYCGHASLNNLLGSLAPPMAPGLKGRFFVALPELVRPFSLQDMKEFTEQVVAASPGVLADTVEKVELFDAWDGTQWGVKGDRANNGAASTSLATEQSYAAFLAMLAGQLNDPRYRFMVNFLRTPLFFCEPDQKHLSMQQSPLAQPTQQPQLLRAASTPLLSKRSGLGSSASTASPSTSTMPLPLPSPLSSSASASSLFSPPGSTGAVPSVPAVSLARKLFSGHWSPLLGYLEPQEVDRVLYRSAATGSATPQSGGAAGGAGYYSYPPSPKLASGASRFGLGLTGSPLRSLGARERNHLLMSASGGGHGSSGGAASSPYFEPASPISEAADSTSSMPPSNNNSGSPPSLELGHSRSASGSMAQSMSVAASRLVESTSRLVASAAGAVGRRGSGSMEPSSSLASAESAAAPSDILAPCACTQPPSTRRSPSSTSDVAHYASYLAAGSVGNSGIAPAATTGGLPTLHSSAAATAAALASPWGAPAPLHYNYPSVSSSSASHGASPALSGSSLHSAERLALVDGLCLLADVNPSYSHFLCPPRRLFEALCTRNVISGEPRGLIRITLRTPQQMQPQPSGPAQ